MGCKLECGLVTLCHGGSRGPFWPKHVVANMFMPQDSAFRHPHCEKCGLAIRRTNTGVDVESYKGGGEAPLCADTESRRTQSGSFRREQLPGARAIVRRIRRTMVEDGDMHGRSRRDQETAERDFEDKT